MIFNFNEAFDFLKKLKSILIIGLLTLVSTQTYAFGTNGTTAGAPVPQTSSFTGNGAGTLGNGVTCEIRIQVADVLSTTPGSTAFTFVRFFGPNSFYGGQAAGGYYYSPDLNSGSWNNLNNSLATNKSAIETACGWTAGSMNVISEVRSGTTFSTETELSTTFQFAYGGGLYQYTGGLSSGSASARATISNALTYVGPYIPAVAPGAPTIGSATSGNTLATVNFTAPATDGGASITSYTASCTSSNGGTTGTASGSASPLTVTGLTNGKNYSCTVTATNSAGTGSASSASNLVTPMGTQTITFANPGAQNFGTTPTLNATSTSGLVVSFTSSTTGVCTTSGGGTLTFLTIGTCTVNADQAGNSSYLAASTVSQSFTVNAVVPNAPTNVSIKVDVGQAMVMFTTPASDGGVPISSYTATCTSSNGGTTGTASGSTSPISVTGLNIGQNYTCTVTATNNVGTGLTSLPSVSMTIPHTVPTLSEWAMMLMTSLMGLFAVFRLKERQI